MKVAIPRLGEVVAPCLEYSATMAIFTVENGKIVDQLDFPLRSREPLDRIRLLRDQQVDTIICGGVQDVFEDLLRARGIQLISWVSGNIENLLDLFLHGRLVASDGRGQPTPDGRSHQKRRGKQK
ncbi:MAG: NifB/NifX family molybdenum-iron cluster-binding protein [Candidatus Latescibacterota bacterium]|nr:MAG: NifB/NifX family molybdenum-iron cluster-binding protein [Candidatus Latescibacterota bacterium]